MAQVILFGGGDAGGLIITSKGIRKIPPYDPALFREFQAIALAHKAQGLSKDRDLHTSVQQLSERSLKQAGAAFGDIAEGESINGFVFADDDGFTCGTTGAPIFHIAGRGPGPRQIAGVAVTELFA